MDLGPLVPIVSIIMGGLWMISRGPVGRAYGRRISGGPEQVEVQQQLAHLTDEVARLSQELSETQERLDFAERLLTRGRDGGART
jgi:hypothetical protein